MRRACTTLCPKFQLAMDVLAKPWNGLIMAALAGGPVRFGELGERLEQIGDRMLSERLKELQERGLVERRVFEGPPVRVEYALSEAGAGFVSVREALSGWGAQMSDRPVRKRAARS